MKDSDHSKHFKVFANSWVTYLPLINGEYEATREMIDSVNPLIPSGVIESRTDHEQNRLSRQQGSILTGDGHQPQERAGVLQSSWLMEQRRAEPFGLF